MSTKSSSVPMVAIPEADFEHVTKELYSLRSKNQAQSETIQRQHEQIISISISKQSLEEELESTKEEHSRLSRRHSYQKGQIEKLHSRVVSEEKKNAELRKKIEEKDREIQDLQARQASLVEQQEESNALMMLGAKQMTALQEYVRELESAAQAQSQAHVSGFVPKKEEPEDEEEVGGNGIGRIDLSCYLYNPAMSNQNGPQVVNGASQVWFFYQNQRPRSKKNPFWKDLSAEIQAQWTAQWEKMRGLQEEQVAEGLIKVRSHGLKRKSIKTEPTDDYEIQVSKLRSGAKFQA